MNARAHGTWDRDSFPLPLSGLPGVGGGPHLVSIVASGQRRAYLSHRGEVKAYRGGKILPLLILGF